MESERNFIMTKIMAVCEFSPDEEAVEHSLRCLGEIAAQEYESL